MENSRTATTSLSVSAEKVPTIIFYGGVVVTTASVGWILGHLVNGYASELWWNAVLFTVLLRFIWKNAGEWKGTLLFTLVLMMSPGVTIGFWTQDTKLGYAVVVLGFGLSNILLVVVRRHHLR